MEKKNCVQKNTNFLNRYDGGKPQLFLDKQ